MDSVLLVDDEDNVLSGYRRSLRGKFRVETASSGAAALELIQANGPYPVIVSDMRMPEMDGVELLSEVKRTHPEMVRVLLTGNSDQQTAVLAINRGDVFRFLNKPCPPDVLGATIATAIEHHRLLKVEQDLLANTLRGSVEMLVELLSLIRPEMLGQTMRIRELVSQLDLAGMDDVEPWTLETAVLLSQLGYTTLSDKLVERIQSGNLSGSEERRQLESAITVSCQLISRIPRLDAVAQIITYQEKHFDGGGFPADGPSGEAIPLGARVLKVLLDFDRQLNQGRSRREALADLDRHSARYDGVVVDLLRKLVEGPRDFEEKIVPVSAVTAAMVLVEDIVTESGVLLVPKGMRASESVQAHLRRFHASGQIGDSVRVYESG